jgi:hypothetical protein
MTITLFVEPKSFAKFVEVNKILQFLDLDNDYVFAPTDLIFTEQMISNWIWINMPVEDYMKLKYCIGKLQSE